MQNDKDEYMFVARMIQVSDISFEGVVPAPRDLKRVLTLIPTGGGGFHPTN